MDAPALICAGIAPLLMACVVLLIVPPVRGGIFTVTAMEAITVSPLFAEMVALVQLTPAKLTVQLVSEELVIAPQVVVQALAAHPEPVSV